MLSRTNVILRRNVSTMTLRNSPAPKEPLVVILGSTGTGKSELAVEIATRFRGEVINADAMQLYRGLPIITNKITPAEQRGVPHHLLDRIPLSAVPWDVTEFKKHALQTIREIRSRGNLPILVGGTHYYVEPLLFTDAILDDVQQDETRTFPILEASTEDMLAELRRVDPEMAEKWHPNDRRKIQRSLEIYLHTGKTASALYAEQQERKTAAAEEESSPWENLLLWVYSERDILCERLDNRVDKMLAGGLSDEVQELQRFHAASAADGTILDTTKGIWQSIGYKQLVPAVAAASRDAPAAEVAQLQATGLEDMKTATRRYANYQNKWIRGKQIPRLRQRGERALNSLYVLDSTDAARYAETVVAPANALVAQFLSGEARQPPRELSDLARRVLEAATETAPAVPQTPLRQTCEVCGTTLVTREAWDRHVKSAGHRRVVRKKKRLALVPVERPQRVEAEEDGDSDPGISSLLASSSENNA